MIDLFGRLVLKNTYKHANGYKCPYSVGRLTPYIFYENSEDVLQET